MTTPTSASGASDRQPGPDHDIHVARADATPLVGPLAVPQPRVDERDTGIEIRPEPIDQGQRQRDLRDEHEGGPTGVQRRGDGFDVDGGLAATGHAIEEQRPRIALDDRAGDPVDGHRLGLGQFG